MATKKHDMLTQLEQILEADQTLSLSEKTQARHSLAQLKKTKVHVLVTGSTGSGKSSTINALFDARRAKVGSGPDPETQTITRYELNNVVLYDSPGLGDGKEADVRHAKNITHKLLETGDDGKPLVDLALVILDGGSRDMGTAFQLINEVVIPALGGQKHGAHERLLVAINQADVAMKGRYWNHEENRPEPELAAFLDEKVQSVQRRIQEATGVDTTPIYYAAGYDDGQTRAQPYNLSKLLFHIVNHVPPEKRVVVAQDINRDPELWKGHDRKRDYEKDTKDLFEDSLVALLGKAVVDVAGKVVRGVGNAIGGVVRGIGSFFSSLW